MFEICSITAVGRKDIHMNETRYAMDAAELKKWFQSENRDFSPCMYFPITSENGLNTEEKISKLIQGYKKSGYGGIIPFSFGKSPICPLSEEYYKVTDTVAKCARENGMQIGYIDDSYIMRAYMAGEENHASQCSILCKYDVACMTGDHMHKEIKKRGKLMSLMAVNDDTQDLLDLRPYLTEEEDKYILDWTVPDGNWNVEQYFCEKDTESPYIDYLDYEISSSYLKATFRVWLDRLGENYDALAPMFIYRNVVYGGRNRRMWNEKFNTVFEEYYGFDPAPYYPLLFRDFGRYSKRYKSMLMVCRAHMLVEGYMKAVADICHAKGVFCTGFPAESKATACSWMFGDGQMLHKYTSAPGISIPFAYLYGLNGIKVAAGAADAFGQEIVSADIFRYYEQLSKDVIYRETMNAFVRGVNMLFAHLGEDRTDEHSTFGEKDPVWGAIFSKNDDLADYANFTTRSQILLRGGEHICDVAILYPIHSLHSFVYLYQSAAAQGFEYPVTPENADYMEIMNSFLNYVGMDSTFVHPNIIRDRAFSENGTLFIKQEGKDIPQKYKVLVMPSMPLISLKTLRVIKKFYDEGGKIIATDNLPSGAYECSMVDAEMNTAMKTLTPEDKEVQSIIRYIFGEDCQDSRIIKQYYKNENENGGQAYFFPSNKTSVDGTESVSASILYQVMEKFRMAPDVYMDGMPRVEFSGIVNHHLPTFIKVGIGTKLAKGCSMNYIHKRYAGCDIYYITNTTGSDYNRNILLRGRLSPEEWNPFTGKIHKLNCELVRFRGDIYTKVNVSIEASSCSFIVSPIQRNQKEILRDLTAEQEIPEYFPKYNF